MESRWNHHHRMQSSCVHAWPMPSGLFSADCTSHRCGVLEGKAGSTAKDRRRDYVGISTDYPAPDTQTHPDTDTQHAVSVCLLDSPDER